MYMPHTCGDLPSIVFSSPGRDASRLDQVMKRSCLSPNLNLSIPPSEQSISKFLTQSGTFKDGDLRVNKDGIQLVSQSEPGAPPPIKPLDDQLSLADLEVIKVIGKGISGNVQLVKHKLTCQFFALKVIRLNIEESTCRAISQELRINLSSQCPYLVSCYQSFCHNGSVSIILEFMDGGSLFDLLKKVERIPENILGAICKQVLQGLTYLHHERRIIHRDLKPSNLLINHRGEVKITDFGVSKILTNTTSLANSVVGTYHYMSPERINGYPYGNKSDIWSLGLLLLECATGKFPYSPPEHGERWTSVYEVMNAIVENPPPSAPSDQFSTEFCSFVSECIKKNPEDRKSAKELLEHGFVKRYDESSVDLSSYFSNAGSLTPTLPNRDRM
ncbi:PREDICTED: mitogen-activated protein kinase kinase 1-like [Tarenaya hassleriana]|uniref:mitogen-activated protein kinase kinase 1-like n=1 Tax=Tarenaya hassleriana TaxID=28532 RepID=UPI00053CA2A9|nr:PREDICTED: mitogen-activated protein kinase kinase 1-like [Tarenaya hassleriana]